MITKLPLKNCELWWPMWQCGIPFDSYGYQKAIEGPGYQFAVDPDMDSWKCPDGKLMPINTSVLKSFKEGKVPFESFSIMGDKVQVNIRIGTEYTFKVCYFALEDLYFEGEAYSEDD